MVSSLKLFSKANLAANEKVSALLADLGPGVYDQDRNTYFKSIRGLQLHLIQTCKYLQALVRTNSNNKYFVSPLTEDSFEVKPETLEAACDLLAGYDRNFVAFCETVEEKDLVYPKVKRTLRNGRHHLVSLSDILTQYMIHTAHHRGQLSQILDELGVDHDIGSVWAHTEVWEDR